MTRRAGGGSTAFAIEPSFKVEAAKFVETPATLSTLSTFVVAAAAVAVVVVVELPDMLRLQPRPT